MGESSRTIGKLIEEPFNPLRHFRLLGLGIDLTRDIGGAFGPPEIPGAPSLTFPEGEDQEPQPLVDEDEARRLAQQRRSLEAGRRGVRSLRIPRPTRSPGLGIGAGAGLRIPG